MPIPDEQTPAQPQVFGPEVLDRINSGDWAGFQDILQWDAYLGASGDNNF